jgi:hypothetical protein
MKRHVDDDKINEILHFYKAIGSFSKLFSDIAKDYKNWHAFHERTEIDADRYIADPSLSNFLRWIDKYVLTCRFLDMNRYSVDALIAIYQQLKSPQLVATVDNFTTLVTRLKSLISFLDKELTEKLSRLACPEAIRLDEALVCFENYSFHASVIMAVSAVENRIIEMIKRTNKRMYNSTFKNFTLGQLIQVFEPDKYKEKKYGRIKKLMPDKHLPLIALLNRYRVFSAHPTEEKITAQIAESMLHLSFAFMIDENTCPYTKDELKCT